MEKNTLYKCVVITEGVIMSFNYGMGGMNMSGMGMMNGMTGMSGMNNSGNVWQMYTAKYGCNDCFAHEPNWYENHTQIHHREQQSAKPNFWQRFLMRIGC